MTTGTVITLVTRDGDTVMRALKVRRISRPSCIVSEGRFFVLDADNSDSAESTYTYIEVTPVPFYSF